MPQIQLLDGKKIAFAKSINGFELTKKIYDAYLKSNAKLFIYFSSIKAVCDNSDYPIDENDTNKFIGFLNTYNNIFKYYDIIHNFILF